MMIFYEGLRTLSPAEALHNAQKKMRNLSQDDVWGLVEMLKIKLKHPKVGDFVDRPRYWIKKLDDLRPDELRNLREPRCWAAFVLTGYGFQHI
jgi:CHAT domain-containing protein